MQKHILLVAITVVSALLSSDLVAQRPNQQKTAKPIVERIFQQIMSFDSNRNGSLESQELQKLRTYLEANGFEGRLPATSQTEVGGGEMNRSGRPSGRGRPSGAQRGGPSANSSAILVKFDKDKDGFLTEKEVPGPMWRRLSTGDSNKDGKLSAKEFEKIFSSLGGRR